MKIAIPMSLEDYSVRLNAAYINYIIGAGFLPIPVPQDIDIISEYAEICDGLLLPGGRDIDPMFYDEENVSSYGVDPDKDAFERDLFHEFRTRGKPTFGICRGLQLISYEMLRLGGKSINEVFSMQQHISGHDRNSLLKIDRSVPTHFVHSRPAILYGSKELGWIKQAVNSMHHQCLQTGVSEARIRALGPIASGVYVTAFTRIGIEPKQAGFIVEGLLLRDWRAAGVQWHPEELGDYELIKVFFTSFNNMPARAVLAGTSVN